MGNFQLDIGEVVVEGVAEKEDEAKKIPEQLKKAFEKLASKLKQSPVAGSVNVPHLVLDKLHVPSMDPQDLFSDAGADRIAEELYQQIIRGG